MQNVFRFWFACVAILVGITWAQADEVRLQLHVLRPDGTAASGARAIFRGIDRQQAQPSAPINAVAVANEQGDVLMNVPRWWSGSLLVDAPDCALRVVSLPSPLTEMAAQRTLTLTEKLSAAYFIRGVTTDQNGTPLGGAQVVVTSEYAIYGASFGFNAPLQEKGVQTPELTTQSAADGSFSLRGFDFSLGREFLLNLPAAQINLLALSRRGGTLSLGVAQADWEGVRNRPIRLQLNAERTLRGRVFDSVSRQGVPGVKLQIAGSVLAITNENFGSLTNLEMPSSRPAATTDAQGRFALTVVPPVDHLFIAVKAPEGFWDSEVSLSSSPSALVQVPEGELNVPLHRVALVAGQVVDVQTKAPIVPVGIIASVEDKLAGGWTNHIETASFYDAGTLVSPDGRFEMKAPVGIVNLEVRGPFAGNGARIYQARFARQVNPGNTKGVNLTLSRPPSLVLRWSDAPDHDSLLLERAALVVQTRSALGAAIQEQISDGPLWMLPVPRWGETLEVRLLKRSITQGKGAIERELMPWTKLVANARQLPTEVHLPRDAFAPTN